MNELQETPETMVVHVISLFECVQKRFDEDEDTFVITISPSYDETRDDDHVTLRVPPGEYADIFQVGNGYNIDMTIYPEVR